jgi:hypothetical protein
MRVVGRSARVRARAKLCLLCLLACACVRAREREQQAQRDYLNKELSFLVPFVDIEAEEKAVRNVLAQRKLVVEEAVRGAGFVALSAATLDQKRTSVRVITSRGVVAAEDGDVDDLFGARKVALMSLTTGGPGSETLLGISKTERAHDLGCASFSRVRQDANLVKVDVHIERFGSRACLVDLKRDADGALLAGVGWPSLSAGVGPTLDVDMRIDSGRLDQSDPAQISLRVDADESRFLARELAENQAALAHAATFPERQALAVARAALALAENQGVDQQLGAYQSTLGHLAASNVYAELIALTRAHIEHGWDDLVPEPDGQPSADEPDPGENVIIDPASQP